MVGTHRTRGRGRPISSQRITGAFSIREYHDQPTLTNCRVGGNDIVQCFDESPQTLVEKRERRRSRWEQLMEEYGGVQSKVERVSVIRMFVEARFVHVEVTP